MDILSMFFIHSQAYTQHLNTIHHLSIHVVKDQAIQHGMTVFGISPSTTPVAVSK